MAVLLIRVLQGSKTPDYQKTPGATSPEQSVILRNATKLRELKELQEKGIISQEEFDTEKKKLLGD